MFIEERITKVSTNPMNKGNENPTALIGMCPPSPMAGKLWLEM